MMLYFAVALALISVSPTNGIITSSKSSIDIHETIPGLLSSKVESVNSYLEGKKGWGSCNESLHALMKNVRAWNVNAWKLVDSWGKPNSGILDGNLNQYGSFDECINSFVDNGSQQLPGKYCLISVEIEVPEKLKDVKNLMYSHFTMKRGSKDFGHRLPHFSDFKWGSCIPSTCPSEIVEVLLNHTSFDIMGENFTVVSRARENMCYTKEEKEKNIPSLAWMFVGTIVALNIVGTIVAALDRRLLGRRYLQAFALNNNWKKILQIKSDDFSELHGIRTASAIGLMLSHKNMAMLYNPYINRTSMVEILGKPWSIIGRTAIIYTDGFILLSGYLAASSFYKELQRKGRIDVPKSLISRYCRLVPSLLTIIVICTLLLPYLNTGPLWNQVVRKHAELCETNWWRNVLFLHNFYGFENMCLTHTHQLGIDFQLFLISPIITYSLWKWPKNGTIFWVAMAILSSLVRYVVTYRNELSVVIYFGVPVSQLLDTANLSYILPHHRLTVYLMGIGVNFFMRKFPQCPFNKVQVLLLWTIAAIGGLVAMIGPYHMASSDYKYDPNEAAMYNMFSPVLWGGFVGWGIIASAYGYGGWLGNLMAWSKFQIFSRLSYSIYLVQFPVFFYNVGVKRNPENYSPSAMFNFEEYGVVVLLSILLTIMVEMPANNLREVLQSQSDPKDKVTKGTENGHINAIKDRRQSNTVSRRMFKQG